MFTGRVIEKIRLSRARGTLNAKQRPPRFQLMFVTCMGAEAREVLSDGTIITLDQILVHLLSTIKIFTK